MGRFQRAVGVVIFGSAGLGAVLLWIAVSSSGEDAPRGIGFAFNRHRVNVATSRAQCRVVLVCAPRLLDADCKTVSDMQLVNAVCRFAELAQP